jgi:hypothetical protein
MNSTDGAVTLLTTKKQLIKCTELSCQTSELLKAGARVCKEGALMFLLMGPTNYQSCPLGVIRIGSIVLSIIPNIEWWTLNIFLKIGNAEPLKRILKRRSKNQSLLDYTMATVF